MATTFKSASTPIKNSNHTWLKFIKKNGSILLIYGFILLLGTAASIYSDKFFTVFNMVNIARQSIILGLIAIGQSMVVLTGGMDFSVGMIARVVGLTVATLFAAQGSDPVFIIPFLLVGTLIGVGLGWINGMLITRTHANPFIITFGIANILRGVGLAISSTPIRGIPEPYLSIYDAKIGIVPVNVIVMALVWAAMYIFSTQTRLGRNIFAVGGSERIAQLSAIRVNRTLVSAYVISGLFAAFAGLFLLARTGVGDPSAAEGMEFQSVVAVAVGGISLYGGKGSIVGTLGGVLLLAMLSNVFTMTQVNIYFQQLLLGLVVLVAVAAYKSQRSA
ncbi:MAG TPA: ABC transporter permease [Anaerolineales bacterium]|nr:ABC transporter permease [Anaerolineales bacterium]